jgi:hypothetical protein
MSSVRGEVYFLPPFAGAIRSSGRPGGERKIHDKIECMAVVKS